MTGDPPPPTPRTPEELIARLVAAFLAYVSALIDATLLPRACRKHLKATFAALFVRFEAKCLTIIQQQRAENAANHPEPTTTPAAQPAKPPAPARGYRQRTKTTPIPTAPQPAAAPTENPPCAEAPPERRAPYRPIRALTRAVAAHPKIFQKPALTTPISHAHIVSR